MSSAQCSSLQRQGGSDERNSTAAGGRNARGERGRPIKPPKQAVATSYTQLQPTGSVYTSPENPVHAA